MDVKTSEKLLYTILETSSYSSPELYNDNKINSYWTISLPDDKFDWNRRGKQF